jgi:hypothetical protein
MRDLREAVIVQTAQSMLNNDKDMEEINRSVATRFRVAAVQAVDDVRYKREERAVLLINTIAELRKRKPVVDAKYLAVLEKMLASYGDAIALPTK